MNRDPGSPVVTFTEPEQATFSVPAELTAEQAVATAMVFEGVAHGLQEVAAQHGVGFPDDRAARLRKAARATELGNFAARVYALCPDEHLKAIAEGDHNDSE